jgi:DNA-binding transcriptional LysR family regulator
MSAPVAFGISHVAPLLPRFIADNPEVRVDFAVNDRFVDLVEEGIDVALRIGELADSSLIARKIAPNRRLVCAAPSYLAARGEPAAPADLVAHNCLVYTYRAQRHDWHFEAADGHQVVTVSGDIETNNAEVLRAAVLAGHGIALLPLWLVGEDLAAGRLVEVLAQARVPDSAIYAVYPHNRHLSPKVRSIVDFLVQNLSRQTKTWGQREGAA